MALPLLAAAAATTIKIGIDIMIKKRSIDLFFSTKGDVMALPVIVAGIIASKVAQIGVEALLKK